MSARSSTVNGRNFLDYSLIIWLKLFMIIIFMLVSKVQLKPTKTMSEMQALKFLSKYGYTDPSFSDEKSGQSSKMISIETLSKAIQEYQVFFGLNVTGILDDDTVKMMSKPRCGVKDKFGHASEYRRKRYSLTGSKWHSNEITYKVTKYPDQISKPRIDDVMKRGFSIWKAYTPLTIMEQNYGDVNIRIRFERGHHGDGEPFDGPGTGQYNHLAHATAPSSDGSDVHFDEDEPFTIGTRTGINLLQIAAHEFGHSLGLDHTDVKGALMHPIYNDDRYFKLHQDDVAGIQKLYGSKASSRQSISTSGGKNLTEPSLPMEMNLCSNGSIDTIFNSAGGETFIFKGDYYWKFNWQNKTTSYPKLISECWLELPGGIDAAFTSKTGETYFFKGSKVWCYSGTKKDRDSPRDIKNVFPGIPDDIDAVTVWGGNEKIYFFKGSKFWRFDPLQNPHVSEAYPKPFSNWEGVPDSLDAAYLSPQWLTYFFKAGNYYRFNDITFAVDSANPPFPHDARRLWFGCKSNSTPNLAAHSTSFLKFETAATNSTNSQTEAKNSTRPRNLFSMNSEDRKKFIQDSGPTGNDLDA